MQNKQLVIPNIIRMISYLKRKIGGLIKIGVRFYKNNTLLVTERKAQYIKQFRPDTDCDKPDEMKVSYAKEKTVNTIVTGPKNVGQLGNYCVRRDVLSFSNLSDAKQHISVKVDMDEMDVTSAESKATYDEIRDWV